MKIACVTTFDLEKPESWPRRHLGLYGAGAKIVQTLRTETVEVTSLKPLGRKRSLSAQCKGQVYRRVFKKNFYGRVETSVARYYARQVDRQLAHTNADILLCPENAIPIANVRTHLPIVLWTDTTLGSLIDFYPYLSNLCQETRHNIFQIERRVLNNCSLIILNSQWAADQAQKTYGISAKKIKVIPRGSSQTKILSDEAFEQALDKRKSGPCQLLFVGVDWQRKGGSTALGVAEVLNGWGIETELHVVGCRPAFEVPAFVKAHGFIDKSTAVGQARLAELFQSAHFLLYPTQADAMGVVLSEAAAFGVPSLASDVGGVSGVVKTGLTGKTFSLGSKPEAYGEFVAEHIKESSRYQALARSTFEHYKNNVGWSAVGEQAREAFRALLAR